MGFTLMDRGFVFQLIAKYIENFGPGDDKVIIKMMVYGTLILYNTIQSICVVSKLKEPTVLVHIC